MLLSEQYYCYVTGWHKEAEMSEDSKQKDGKSGNWFKRHKVLTVVGVIIVLAIIGSAGGSKDKAQQSASSTGSASKTSVTKSEEATTPKINQPARDGKFEFTVTKITCGEKTIGTNQYLQKTAQGQYCRLSLTIKNIGDKAQPLFSNDQKLAANGKEYSADDTATIYAAPEATSGTWYNSINPGNTVSGDILFDIPADVTPIIAILHDSSLSQGVTISLTQ